MTGKQFFKKRQKALDFADLIVLTRNQKYPGLNPADYYTCIPNSVEAAFVNVTEKYLRLKCAVNDPEMDKDNVREQAVDLLNFTSFLLVMNMGVK